MSPTPEVLFWESVPDSWQDSPALLPSGLVGKYRIIARGVMVPAQYLPDMEDAGEDVLVPIGDPDDQAEPRGTGCWRVLDTEHGRHVRYLFAGQPIGALSPAVGDTLHNPRGHAYAVIAVLALPQYGRVAIHAMPHDQTMPDVWLIWEPGTGIRNGWTVQP